jgi:uncharacterized membrane protein YphA (DoxX/SURF4 family)
MIERLITSVRVLLGLVYVINGTNWFFKIITPYPSISDFVDYMPPEDIVGALIDQGVLFHLAKAIELIGGIALLANRFVPLSLVVAMTVTVPVFIVDVFKPEWKLRAFLMGSGALAMNVTLLIAYYHHYRPMMAWRATASGDPARAPVPRSDAAADLVGSAGRRLLPVLAVIAAAVGSVMVIWLLVMIGQHAADPKGIYEIREMTPRARQTEPG